MVLLFLVCERRLSSVDTIEFLGLLSKLTIDMLRTDVGVGFVAGSTGVVEVLLVEVEVESNDGSCGATFVDGNVAVLVFVFVSAFVFVFVVVVVVVVVVLVVGSDIVGPDVGIIKSGGVIWLGNTCCGFWSLPLDIDKGGRWSGCDVGVGIGVGADEWVKVPLFMLLLLGVNERFDDIEVTEDDRCRVNVTVMIQWLWLLSSSLDGKKEKENTL